MSGRSRRPTAWHIYLPGHAPFSFAGLWAHNSNLDITSCTIITEPAGELMKNLHDRQPVILDQAYYDAWLDPATPKEYLKDILSHDIDGKLQFNPVGRDVNSTVVNKQPNDHPALVGPINPL
ncbi:SOS response-associated peptidase family protein [Mesorhizobium jarvisii]